MVLMRGRDEMAAKSSVLLLTDDVVLPVRAVLSAMRDVGTESYSEDDVYTAQCESFEGKLPIESADAAFIALKRPELVGERWLQEIARVLKPDGKLLLQTIITSDTQEKSTSKVERKLLMEGFVEVQSIGMKLLLSDSDAQSITFKAKKASWTTGSSFPLKKAVSTVPKIVVDSESDLIDEDSLLTEEDLKKPQLPIIGDCEVGSSRKACKNCTCGRAQSEETVQKHGLTTEQLNNPQSACGNCGLGDAFRCSGCPYRGLPPFKPGEKARETQSEYMKLRFRPPRLPFASSPSSPLALPSPSPPRLWPSPCLASRRLFTHGSRLRTSSSPSTSLT